MLLKPLLLPLDPYAKLAKPKPKEQPVLRTASSFARAVVDGKLFVAGGLGVNGQQLSSIEVFHPNNDSWTQFSSLPSGRSEIGCAASGNNLVVAGGECCLTPKPGIRLGAET